MAKTANIKLISVLIFAAMLATGCESRERKAVSPDKPPAADKPPGTTSDQTRPSADAILGTEAPGGEPFDPLADATANGDPASTQDQQTPDMIDIGGNGERRDTPGTTRTGPEVPATDRPAGSGAALPPSGGGDAFGSLRIQTPAGWTLHQQAEASGVTLRGFARGNDYLRIYSTPRNGLSLQSIFLNGAQVSQPEREETIGGIPWRRIDTTKGTIAVSGFLTEISGRTYYGFVRAGDRSSATTAADAFLKGVSQ